MHNEEALLIWNLEENHLRSSLGQINLLREWFKTYSHMSLCLEDAWLYYYRKEDKSQWHLRQIPILKWRKKMCKTKRSKFQTFWTSIVLELKQWSAQVHWKGQSILILSLPCTLRSLVAFSHSGICFHKVLRLQKFEKRLRKLSTHWRKNMNLNQILCLAQKTKHQNWRWISQDKHCSAFYMICAHSMASPSNSNSGA